MISLDSYMLTPVLRVNLQSQKPWSKMCGRWMGYPWHTDRHPHPCPRHAGPRSHGTPTAHPRCIRMAHPNIP